MIRSRRSSRRADEITLCGIELLAAKAKAKARFFISLHYFDPHTGHTSCLNDSPVGSPEGCFAEIAFFDEQFGKLIDAVRQLELDSEYACSSRRRSPRRAGGTR